LELSAKVSQEGSRNSHFFSIFLNFLQRLAMVSQLAEEAVQMGERTSLMFFSSNLTKFLGLGGLRIESSGQGGRFRLEGKVQHSAQPCWNLRRNLDMSSPRPIHVSLLGCGTVGGGVLELLRDNARYLESRVGAPLVVRKVLVRELSKPRVAACEPKWLTTNPDEVLNDPECDVLVEVMGGVEPAYRYLKTAISKKIGVVTANKMALAFHGGELIDSAVAAGVDIAFEASVGGGIPIIRTLREALTGDWVESLAGIVNGTCNFVLTKMRNEGWTFDEAVKEAQKLGYAEADPTLDVDGHDAAQKLCVIAMLGFGARVRPQDIRVEGIRTIESIDHRFAERFGLTIKHLAIGRDHGDRIELRVHPTLVPNSSTLGSVSGVMCAVQVHGRALGPCLLSGQGAGAGPTAVSVVADLVDVARAKREGIQGFDTRGIQMAERVVMPIEEVESACYMRLQVNDEPGVLAKIASALAKQGVSIEQMVQEGRAKRSRSDQVDVVMTTYRAPWGKVQTAIEEMKQSGFVGMEPRVFRIEQT
jgi:homoserine dehydrogenase